MMRPRSVLLILMLLAGSLSPPGASPQGSQVVRQPPVDDSPAFVLEQHYPPTLSSETWIPFTLSPGLFDNGREVAATIRIYNGLGQVVAIPEAVDHPLGPGTRVINLTYSDPGRKMAYWDGKDPAGRALASGVYYIQLVVGDEVGGTNKIILDNPSRPRRRLIPW
jgi:hypothetical protein